MSSWGWFRLVMDGDSTKRCFLPAGSALQWFYQMASGRDGVAKGGDAAGRWAAKPGLAGMARAMQPPPAPVTVLGETMTPRAGVKPMPYGGHRGSWPLLPSSLRAPHQHSPRSAWLLITMCPLKNSFPLPP